MKGVRKMHVKRVRQEAPELLSGLADQFIFLVVGLVAKAAASSILALA